MAKSVRRRAVLVGGTAAGALVVTGCSSSSKPSSQPAQSTTSSSPTSAPTETASPSAASTRPLVKLADIPVGSAVAAKGPSGQPLIVARPTSTTAVAFSAICTHRGCTVAPAGERLDCPCHGSRYAATTGKVLRGPAPAPLPGFAVEVANGEVVPA